MMLEFREITEGNFQDCVKLRVRDDQRFVAPNVYSIAQAKVGPRWVIKGIYADETMVGFAMYKFSYPQRELYLCRFMIDARYQHMGYGRGALQLLKEIASNDPGIDKIVLSTNPKNEYGIKVYEKFGFKDTGVLDEDEEVFELVLNRAVNGA
jgi:diamine N-acetyltransferase